MALVGRLRAGGWNSGLLFVCYWLLSWGGGRGDRLWENQVVGRTEQEMTQTFPQKGWGWLGVDTPYPGHSHTLTPSPDLPDL